MSWFRPKISDESPRLFENDFFEMLSRTHPAVVVIIYLPVSLALIWYSVARAGIGIGATVLLIPGGAVAWTLTEYWLHRVIMHWIPESNWGPRMHFWIHGIHHEWPNDPYRLVMPPTVSIALFFIFLGVFRLVLGPYCWAFHGGFTIGYIVYDMSHYLFHHSKPRSAWVKGLQRHHLLHHFNPRYEDLHFSITTPLWDRLFGTTRPPETSRVDTSQRSRRG
jgi:sterol desaturase/sphingolipid hydroxylase (fatty acid hydroxylase superfamily)